MKITSDIKVKYQWASMKKTIKLIVIATIFVTALSMLLVYLNGTHAPETEDTSNTQQVKNTCKDKREGGYIAEFITPPPSSLEELAERSDVIAAAEVISCAADSKKSIGLNHVFHVESVVKGELQTDEITISVDKDYRTPLLSDGDQVLLFLREEPGVKSSYRTVYSGSTIAFRADDKTFSFSEEAELSIQETFGLSDL